MQKLVSFLGINKSIGVMIAVVIFVGLGEKMAERFLPIYLLALGGSAFSVGLLNALDNFLSAIYSFPGGYLSHKIGHKKALIIFTLIAMFGYCLVIIIPRWEAVLIGAVFFIAWTAVSLPAIMNLIATTLRKDKRTMGVSVHSFVRRIPMALGPVLGGLFIGWYGEVSGIKIAFVVAFALGLIAILLIRYLMEDDSANNNVKDAGFLAVIRKFKPSLVHLLVSDILIRFAEQIPYAFVVIWVVKNNGVSPFEFGLLTVVEMVTAMLVYIPVAYYADRHFKKPFVLVTFGFFTLFPLVLCYAKTFPILVIAFIIRGLKEFGEPTRKALIMDLAPDDIKAATFGTYYLIRDVVVSLAALASAWLWNISPETNFMVAFGCGMTGTVLFLIFGKDLKNQEAED